MQVLLTSSKQHLQPPSTSTDGANAAATAAEVTGDAAAILHGKEDKSAINLVYEAIISPVELLK